MRARNWAKDNRQLIQRGSLEFLINPKKSKCPGRPHTYTDALILILLMVKVQYSLPYKFFLTTFLKLCKKMFLYQAIHRFAKGLALF